MQDSILNNIRYTVVRSARRKTLCMTVYPNNKIIVKASSSAPENRIKDFVQRKADWLKKKVEFNSTVRKPYIPKIFREGEVFLYLGRSLPLVIDNHSRTPQAFFRETCIYMKLPQRTYSRRPDYIGRKLKKCYKMRARDIFKERIRHYQPVLGVKTRGLKVRSLSRTWGSCSHDGILSLNWKLVMAPLAIIDYVVVHELCHLIHPNHSPKFWNTLKALIPDHRKRREWLVIHENSLKF